MGSLCLGLLHEHIVVLDTVNKLLPAVGVLHMLNADVDPLGDDAVPGEKENPNRGFLLNRTIVTHHLNFFQN